MLILHIINALNIGGAELMLKRLIEAQIKNSRFQVVVISLTDLGTVGLMIQNLGVKVFTFNLRSVSDLPIVVWRLVRFMRCTKPHIIQTWMYHADLLGGLASRLAGNANVVWGIRTSELGVGRSRMTLLIRKLCAWVSFWMPNIIVCNAEASRLTHVAVGYNKERMIVIPNGFDLSFLVATSEQRLALRSQCGFCEDDIVIGSLGRFNAVKDHPNFVRAACLLARRNSHVRFLMAGRNVDENNRKLSRLIADTDCPDRFVLLGERADVAVCLAAMDIFCLHSRTEGFPNVVGEAMAMGLSCVVTNVGDAAMLVADTGVVVPKEDYVALAQGLDMLLAKGPEAWRQLGQKAKIRIHTEFTIKRACERFNEVYQRVLDKESH